MPLWIGITFTREVPVPDELKGGAIKAIHSQFQDVLGPFATDAEVDDAMYKLNVKLRSHDIRTGFNYGCVIFEADNVRQRKVEKVDRSRSHYYKISTTDGDTFVRNCDTYWANVTRGGQQLDHGLRAHELQVGDVIYSEKYGGENFTTITAIERGPREYLSIPGPVAHDPAARIYAEPGVADTIQRHLDRYGYQCAPFTGPRDPNIGGHLTVAMSTTLTGARSVLHGHYTNLKVNRADQSGNWDWYEEPQMIEYPDAK